jgi:hypothetical protein
MTPEDLILELGCLVVAHRNQEALELTSRHLPSLGAAMTSEQVVRVAELAHVAQMAVDLEAWDAANRQAEAEAPASRTS